VDSATLRNAGILPLLKKAEAQHSQSPVKAEERRGNDAAYVSRYGPLLRFAPFHRFFLTKTVRSSWLLIFSSAARQARLHSTRIVNLDLSGAVDESNLAKLFHEKARGTVVPIVSANVS
jgi:hypothetical protein